MDHNDTLIILWIVYHGCGYNGDHRSGARAYPLRIISFRPSEHIAMQSREILNMQSILWLSMK